MHRIDEREIINITQFDKIKHSCTTPKTVNDDVERLSSELVLKDKVTLANLAEIELSTLHVNPGEYIRNEVDLWHDNRDLLTSCCFFVKRDNIRVSVFRCHSQMCTKR